MASAVLTSEMETVIGGRKVGDMNRFAKLKSGALSLTTAGQPYVDESNMSARAIINTPREDREGDVILPMGVQLDNYRANPVVLWEHGLGTIDTPIAKCMTPEGELALTITEDEITGVSYFSENDQTSYQIFSLIADGLVRATSVRATPIKSQARKTADGIIAMLLEEWELVEWSWGCMGVNPDAVAKAIEKGVNGEKLIPQLLKSLTAVAPKPADFFKGITLPKEEAVEDPKLEDETTKTDTPEETADETKMEDEEPVADLERMDETMMEEDDISVPMGSKVLRSAYTALRSVKSELEAATGPLEQADVKQVVEEVIAQIDDMQKAIDGCHTKTYTEQDALSKMDDVDDEESADAAMKSLSAFLSQGNNKYKLAGLRTEMKSFATCKNLTPAQKKRLAGWFKSLQRIEKAAASHKPDVNDQKVDELADQLAALTKTVRDMAPA